MNEFLVYEDYFEPVGYIHIIVGLSGVEKLSFGKFSKKNYKYDNFTKKEFNSDLKDWFSSYFAGKTTPFPINLAISGTLFQKKVWNEIKNITYGQVKTYSEIAKCIGKPSAARAVGNACGKNPLPLITPCHRVVSTTGIGGFSSNLNIKKRLLKAENSYTP